MKLKVQHVMDATIALTNIINRAPVMPQKGKYRIARLHAKLLPEFRLIDARRDEMIKAYNNPQMRAPTPTAEDPHAEGPMVPVEGQWQVPADKMDEFTAAWKQVGDEEIEVDAEPMPLEQLCLSNDTDGAIEASELITLGDLVQE